MCQEIRHAPSKIVAHSLTLVKSVIRVNMIKEKNLPDQQKTAAAAVLVGGVTRQWRSLCNNVPKFSGVINIHEQSPEVEEAAVCRPLADLTALTDVIMLIRWGICSAGKISHDFTVALKTLSPEHHQVNIYKHTFKENDSWEKLFITYFEKSKFDIILQSMIFSSH